jgi:hypothetical protein
MTETSIAATMLPTPLATLLGSAAKPPGLAEYHCVLTPQELDAPEAEIAALTAGAAVHDLGWLRRVAVRGEDRFRWLSGMVTNMVNDLGANTGSVEPGAECAGAHPGRPDVWREEDELELEIAADQFETADGSSGTLHHHGRCGAGSAGTGDCGCRDRFGIDRAASRRRAGMRMGLPTLTAGAMTGTRVEWNGLDLRILRGLWRAGAAL